MKIKNKLPLILAVLPLLFTSIALIFMPNTVPVHFGINAQPDRYGSKFEFLMLPAILIATYIIFIIARKFLAYSSTDEEVKSKNNLKILTYILSILFATLNCIQILILIIIFNPKYLSDKHNILTIGICVIMGLMMIFLGNIMPKTKRNSILGMRLSFSMKNDTTWYIANRSSGIGFVISGIISIISAFVFQSNISIFVMIISLFVCQIIAAIYSYVVIKRKEV